MFSRGSVEESSHSGTVAPEGLAFAAVGENLTEVIVRRSATALGSMTPKEAADTYVVSFWVNDDADDPSIPVLRVGTNTEAQVHASLAKASSADEARWNFAYWLQNDLAVVGGHGDDDGRTMVDARFHELGLRRDDGDFSPDALEVCRQMTETFVACCVDAACRLHDHDGLVGTFGRDIPVLVHELEYYDAIAEQNLACNPPDLVAPFKQ